MRYPIRSLVLTGILALAAASTVHADAPTDKKSDEARFKEIPALRESRQKLEQIVKDLDKDVADPKGYRHKAIADVKQAIAEISAEISEYKVDETKDQGK